MRYLKCRACKTRQRPDFSQGIDIQALLGDFVRSYLRQAPAHTAGNKTQAASLLGLKSQQALSNWMEKYDID